MSQPNRPQRGSILRADGAGWWGADFFLVRTLKKLTLLGAFTGPRSWTFPDSSSTFAGITITNTFTPNQWFSASAAFGAAALVSTERVRVAGGTDATTLTPGATDVLMGGGAVNAGAGLKAGANSLITASVDARLSLVVINTSAGTLARSVIGTQNSDVTTGCGIYSYNAAYSGSIFGVARANDAELVANGASLTSLIIGVAGISVPIVFGINASEVARLTSGTIASGALRISYTTEATSPTAAAETIAGGLGVAKRIFGGTIGTTFQGHVLAGVQDGTADTVGALGETLVSTVTATAAGATGTPANATSVSVTRGAWMGRASVTISAGATGLTAASTIKVSINTTTATNGTNGSTMVQQSVAALVANGFHTISIEIPDINISAAATYYLVVEITYSAGSPTLAGSLIFTRKR